MKKILLVLALIFSNAAFAEENAQVSGEKFVDHKQQMISNLNAQKAVIDQTISCVNSAQNIQDIKKCYEIREQAARQIRQNNIEQRKAELQNQINKLEAKKQELGNKPTTGNVK
jgi:hypothetical protein